MLYPSGDVKRLTASIQIVGHMGATGAAVVGRPGATGGRRRLGKWLTEPGRSTSRFGIEPAPPSLVRDSRSRDDARARRCWLET